MLPAEQENGHGALNRKQIRESALSQAALARRYEASVVELRTTLLLPDRAGRRAFIPPRQPQTNGMVERFNGRVSEIVQLTPIRAFKEWRQKEPELSLKRGYDQAGLESPIEEASNRLQMVLRGRRDRSSDMP